MSKSRHTIIFGASLTCSLLLSGAASESFAAVDLNPAQSTAVAQASGLTGGVVSDFETTHAAATSPDGRGSGTADVDLARTTLAVHGEGVGNGVGAISTASLDYQFAVAGPDTLNVPIWVRAGITIEFPFITGNGSNGNGYVQIVQSNGPDIEFSDCNFVGTTCVSGNKPSVLLNTEALFQSNQAISVDMFASADGTDGIANTTVDPYFFIDPAFLAANPGYSLTFSDGIGNAFIGLPGVPEPATWAMFILGFGAIGGMLRRSRTYNAQPV